MKSEDFVVKGEGQRQGFAVRSADAHAHDRTAQSNQNPVILIVALRERRERLGQGRYRLSRRPCRTGTMPI
jgi:hypothetical protein